MRVIIAGSRGFNDYDLLESVCLNRFTQLTNEGIWGLTGDMFVDIKGIEIVSGTAKGVDQLGEKFASKFGMKIVRFHPNWEANGKSAGYIRNHEMASYAKEDSGILIAFWDGKSRGTQHMISSATISELKIFIINYKEGTMEEKLEAFKEELKYIRNDAVREFTEEAIKLMPDYFFEVGASSTGKYHPEYAKGKGGLLRHTKVAVRVAIELSKLSWWGFTENDIDFCLSALILHDGWKHGKTQEKFARADHPAIARFAIEKSSVKNKQFISLEKFELIMDCIASHMGQWNTKWNSDIEILPKPQTKFQKFVHLADYIASRRLLEANLEFLPGR